MRCGNLSLRAISLPISPSPKSPKSPEVPKSRSPPPKSPVSIPSWISGAFVDDPRYAGLFGYTVGRESHSFRQGEQDHGIVVPAIPAVELSGKVIDEDGNSISGCEIELLTPRNVYHPLRLVASNRTAAANR